jgi:hypothetical protein
MGATNLCSDGGKTLHCFEQFRVAGKPAGDKSELPDVWRKAYRSHKERYAES